MSTPNPVPVLDLEKDFGEIVGDPVAKYEQNFARFDATGAFIGMAPASYMATPPPKKVNHEADKAREKIEAARRQQAEEAALNRAVTNLPTVEAGRQPQSIMEAAHENAQAAAAETHADG